MTQAAAAAAAAAAHRRAALHHRLLAAVAGEAKVAWSMHVLSGYPGEICMDIPVDVG